ncbi:hypothetical protein BC832DRAFT_594520 [Gaertneriomyces semiglobifer]|nr:hypothetical protein BC832DRAFT_594520 [Gaertneriomyces semiglobifer]
MSQLRDIRYLKIDWKGNSNPDPSGAMDYIINNLQPGQFPILSYTIKYGRLWGALTLEEITRIIQTNHGIHEILHPDMKRKVYFDVDKSTLPSNEIKEIILKRFPNANMQISGREGSWHITLSNYYAQNLSATLNTLRPFAVEHGFDRKVYNRNQNYKCIRQSKRGEPVQEYVEGSHTLSKHLVLHDFDDDAIDIATMDFGYDEVTTCPSKKKQKTTNLDILAIPQEDLPVPDHYDCLHAKPLEKLAILPNPQRGKKDALDHQLSWQVMLWSKGIGLSFKEFWSWCRRKDSSAIRYMKYMQAWNSDKYNISPKFMDALLQRFYPEINVSSSTQHFQHQFDIMKATHSTITNGDYLRNADISSPIKKRQRDSEATDMPGAERPIPAGMPEISSYFHKTRSKPPFIKYSFLTSPMGRNKTGAVVDFITRYGRIVCRQLQHYSKEQKDEGKLDECKFLICSIQLLHYTTKAFDMVVIDEPETVFTTFIGNAPTHNGHMITNWNVLLGHLESAQKVILMDAFTTKLSVNFIKGVIRRSTEHIGEHYEIVDTKSGASPRQFIEMETFDAWMTHIMQAVERGEKLYIFTPYKSGSKGVTAIVQTLQKLMKWEENKHIFGYYAEKEKEKKRLCDAEKVWGDPECRCVVTNGTISVGVNFDSKDVFDKIYGFYAPFIPVRDFIQSLYRVRHPKSTSMVLYREKTRTFGFERKHFIRHPDCEIYQQLQKDLQIELNAYDNTKNWETFNMFCQKANITIYPIHISMSHVDNQRYLDCYADMCELAFAWQLIQDIDEEKAKELRLKTYNTTATLDDRLQLEKYFFKSKFIDNAPEEDLEKVLRDNKVQLGEPLPKTMVNHIPLDEIRKRFHFDRPIKNTQSGVIAQMLNAFFGMKVYSWKKQKQDKRERHYEYETDKLYLGLSQICLEFGKTVETVRWEDVECLM